MINSAPYKARLEAQVAELEQRLRTIEADLDEPHDPDASERAVQMEDDDALEGQARVIASTIASSQRALARIAAGTYGICVDCGATIAAGRLDARPEAALCIQCASMASR